MGSLRFVNADLSLLAGLCGTFKWSLCRIREVISEIL